MTIHCKSALRPVLAALALLGLLIVAGCGNKGPLVHPSPAAPASSAGAPAAASSTAD